MEKSSIYLDDIRTPTASHWIVVRSYDEFITSVTQIGLENIAVISLDHDLDESAMREYHQNVSPNFTLDYNNILKKTGYDCAKWLVDHFYEKFPDWLTLPRHHKRQSDMTTYFPQIFVHSANPIGSANIMGYINNFYLNESQPQSCVRIQIAHTVT